MKLQRTLVIAFICVLFLLLDAVFVSFTYGSESVTLEQAISLALSNNPGLKQADAQVEAADAGVLQSSSGFLPKVSVSEIWSKTDNPMMVLGTKLNQEIVTPSDFNPQLLNNPESISNYNTRLSVMQPVFNGGKEYIGRSQAKLSKEASVNQRERTRQETVYSVIKAYYGLLLAKAHQTAARQSLETSDANLRLAEARYQAGAVLQSDLLRARVQNAEVREMFTRSENTVKIAAAALNFAMGVPQGNEYDITGELSPRELDADLNGLLAEAEQKRPDLAAVELGRQNSEKSIALAKADYLPNLNLMGQVDWNSARAAGDEAKSWAVMAVLQWNLFDGLVTRSRVREAAAGNSRARALEQQTRDGVQLQVRQAYYAVSSSRDRIAATATSVQEAEEGLRIIQKRYESGMTTFVDVLGAENALIRARTSSLQALYDNNVALAELKLAIGTL